MSKQAVGLSQAGYNGYLVVTKLSEKVYMHSVNGFTIIPLKYFLSKQHAYFTEFELHHFTTKETNGDLNTGMWLWSQHN